MKKHTGHVFPRVLNRPLPTAQNASGVWITDDRGNRYLDASGGAIVVNVGHGRGEIADAVYDQIRSHYYVHPTMFTSPAVETLAARLAGHAPEDVDRFYFMSSGSEAVEAAVKLCRQIHLANHRPHKFRLISRWRSYHGLTMGALSAMGRTVFRTPFAPMLADAVHIPPPYCLRCSFGLTYPACDLRCATHLAETIENLGPDTVSAFLAETVCGGTLAAYPPPEPYYRIIRDICDRYDVLLILDEVMCGMGRTGRWFASEHYGVAPDVVTLGKGLSGGAIPFSAVGVRGTHFDSIRAGKSGFVHGGTFSHHAVGAAAANAVMDILENENLVERVASLGPMIGKALEQRLSSHPHVADIRGKGFLWGVELVADRDTLKPFARADQITEKIWDAAFRRGVIVYKSTGLAGIDGDAFLVAPPFVIEQNEIDQVADTIQAALKDVFGR